VTKERIKLAFAELIFAFDEFAAEVGLNTKEAGLIRSMVEPMRELIDLIPEPRPEAPP
jgi:hypothetical protein